MRKLFSAFLLAAVALPATDLRAQAEDDPELTEWTVPWDGTRPRDPYVGPAGDVWFVGQQGHYIGKLDPETGSFMKHDLPDGTGPHNLVVAPDGTIWYTGNRVANIGKMDPESGEIETYDMPDGEPQDPHTLIFGEDGNLWFTAQGGNMIGKLWKESGQIRLVDAPQAEGRGGRMSGVRPYGIEVDSEGNPWIALFGTNLIGTVDPETFELKTFELPEGTRPRRLGLTSDDTVWYVDYARGYLGRLDPTSGAVEEFALPGGAESRPYGMAVDGDDRIWLVETGVEPNQFVGFDPELGEFISRVPVESGGGTVRHMYFHEPTNTIWFGADTNTIGRAVLPPKRKSVS
jgi:virginiamycin B lyase